MITRVDCPASGSTNHCARSADGARASCNNCGTAQWLDRAGRLVPHSKVLPSFAASNLARLLASRPDVELFGFGASGRALLVGPDDVSIAPPSSTTLGRWECSRAHFDTEPAHLAGHYSRPLPPGYVA